jgi:hypothetical protein
MKRTVEVTAYVEVEIDESKFTPEFMETFRAGFFPFHTVEEHIEHLAQLKARGVIGWEPHFAEGYGRLDEMGIKISDPADDMETRVLPEPQHELD